MSDLARVLPWSEEESELVAELQGGSGEAFNWLVTHYSGPVYSLVAGMVPESCDAADVTQDVFLKVFRGIRGFRRGSSLKTWLYRIAVREALNYRRWFRRHHRQQSSIDAQPFGGQAAMEIEDESGTPFDQAASREVQEAVRRALRDVPEVFRSAVILRDLEGMSYEDVAEVLEVSVGTVKSRILRGRRLLRDLLEPWLGNSGVTHTPPAAETDGMRGHVHHNGTRPRSEAVVPSTLFSTMSEGISDRFGMPSGANSGAPGDAEGGV